MKHPYVRSAVAALLLAGLHLATPAWAQARPDTAALLAAQRDAMAPLAYMDGVWRGTAWTMRGPSDKHTVTHTERVGPFLGGTVKVIEGRSYEADGRVGFNAFGTISYDPGKRSYTMHSYALGGVGDFELAITPNGYAWTLPAGPNTSIHYVATIKDGSWVEVGDLVAAGKEPVRIFEMRLKRVGDTDWPAAGAVSPQ
jgi:hypothetical protein